MHKLQAAEAKSRQGAQQRNKKKFKKVQEIHNRLVACIGDHVWKESILECTWAQPDSVYTYGSYQQVVTYSNKITSMFMERAVSAPSYYSKRAITSLMQNIKKVFDVLHDNNFFAFDFLSGVDSDFESTLRQVCKEHITRESFFQTFSCRSCNPLIEAEKVFLSFLLDQLGRISMYAFYS